MPETNRIEYKQKLTGDLEKEVVAFLNYHEGGVIYIGIDKNGHAVEVKKNNDVKSVADFNGINIFFPEQDGYVDILFRKILNLDKKTVY